MSADEVRRSEQVRRLKGYSAGTSGIATIPENYLDDEHFHAGLQDGLRARRSYIISSLGLLEDDVLSLRY